MYGQMSMRNAKTHLAGEWTGRSRTSSAGAASMEPTPFLRWAVYWAHGGGGRVGAPRGCRPCGRGAHAGAAWPLPRGRAPHLAAAAVRNHAALDTVDGGHPAAHGPRGRGERFPAAGRCVAGARAGDAAALANALVGARSGWEHRCPSAQRWQRVRREAADTAISAASYRSRRSAGPLWAGTLRRSSRRYE